MNQEIVQNITTEVQDLERNLRCFIEQSRLVNLYQDAYTRNLKVDIDGLTLSESDRIKLEYYSEKQDNVLELFDNYRDYTKPQINSKISNIKALYNTFNSRLSRLLASSDISEIKKGLAGINTAIEDMLNSTLNTDIASYKNDLEKEIDGLNEDEEIIVDSLSGEAGSLTKLKEQVKELTKSMAESNSTLAKGAIEQGKAVVSIVKNIIKDVAKGAGSDGGSGGAAEEDDNDDETSESEDKAEESSDKLATRSVPASKRKMPEISDETKGVITAQIKVISEDLDAQSQAEKDWNNSFTKYQSILAEVFRESQVSSIILNKSQLLASLKDENHKFKSAYEDYIGKVEELKQAFENIDMRLDQEGSGQWFQDTLKEYETQLSRLQRKAESFNKYLK